LLAQKRLLCSTQPEIADTQSSEVIGVLDKDVFRFEVAVDDILRVDVLEAEEDMPHYGLAFLL
jgi:hypothetical protein